jgi:hypothetical protein
MMSRRLEGNRLVANTRSAALVGDDGFIARRPVPRPAVRVLALPNATTRATKIDDSRDENRRLARRKPTTRATNAAWTDSVVPMKPRAIPTGTNGTSAAHVATPSATHCHTGMRTPVAAPAM